MAENSAIQQLKVFFSDQQNNDQNIQIQPLTPDASTREYFRVKWFGETAIACVYPPDEQGLAQFDACLDVTKLFLASELPVAAVLASDRDRGIIVHEDFGDVILREILQKSDSETREKYLNSAISLIARIQSATAKAFEMNSIASRLKFDFEKLSWELDFFVKHYFETLNQRPLNPTLAEKFKAELDQVAAELADRAAILTHRDFHAANLMLLNGELKIIDHQDARLGSSSYDLVSLLLDRVTTLPSPAWLAEKRLYFLAERERLGLEKIDEQTFADEFRLQTIQRCLKAIGTFSFQSAMRGKTNYLQYIKPMFAIVLRAVQKIGKYPTIEKVIKEELKF